MEALSSVVSDLLQYPLGQGLAYKWQRGCSNRCQTSTQLPSFVDRVQTAAASVF
eukprot:COSAG03_NODE_11197_length_606_cov_1.341223_1_plen_53_part_01